MATELAYQSGFGNGFATEAAARRPAAGPQHAADGALRPLRRATQRLAFTAPRASNQRSWLYRRRPTVRAPGRFGKAEPVWGAPRPAARSRPRPPHALGPDRAPGRKPST